MFVSVSDPRVKAVRFEIQEMRVDERVKRHLAERRFHSAQPLCLFERQSQTRHFQVCRADA
jgi:hypothetical protein